LVTDGSTEKTEGSTEGIIEGSTEGIAEVSKDTFDASTENKATELNPKVPITTNLVTDTKPLRIRKIGTLTFDEIYLGVLTLDALKNEIADSYGDLKDEDITDLWLLINNGKVNLRTDKNIEHLKDHSELEFNVRTT